MAKNLRHAPIGTCIFCPKQDMSEEHIWPQWVEREQLFPDAIHTQYYGLHNRLTNERKQRLNRKTVRCTCQRDCNNGWISRLNENAKEVTKALALGHDRILNAREQQILSAQATTMTMVAEWATPATTGISVEQRKSFMQSAIAGNPTPPPGMYIWIGRCRLNRELPVSRDRDHWVLRTPRGITIEPPVMPVGAQMNIFTFGQLVLVIFASARIWWKVPAAGGDELDTVIGMPGLPLLRIWPLKIDNYPWPPFHIFELQDFVAVKGRLADMMRPVRMSFFTNPRVLF